MNKDGETNFPIFARENLSKFQAPNGPDLHKKMGCSQKQKGLKRPQKASDGFRREQSGVSNGEKGLWRKKMICDGTVGRCPERTTENKRNWRKTKKGEQHRKH